MANIYRFTKQAAQILDHQDDPGAGWEVLQHFWPEWLPEPSIGTDLNKEACLANMSDGFESSYRYPVDTPSNALASAMYFMAFGAPSMDSADDMAKLANHLDDYLDIHGVEIPEDFIEALEEPAESELPEEEVYADEAQHLPVTTPEQTMMSITAFTNNLDRWSAEDQMLNSARLHKAAEYHGIPKVQLPLAGMQMSKNASGALTVREAVMKKIAGYAPQQDHKEAMRAYFDGLDYIREELAEVQDYGDLRKLAGALEYLDREFGMDEVWGTEIPTPAESMVLGAAANPFADTYKQAAADWDSVNWDDIPLDPSYVDAIRDDPETVIPTLPIHERQIVEDVVYGKTQ